MSLWNTEQAKIAILAIPEVSLNRISLGEYYTTDGIDLDVAGSEKLIYVRGFSTDRLSQNDNVDVEMVEVSTGYSDGDMPDDPDYCIIHARVKAALMRLGHRVVNSLDRYF